MNFTRRSFVGNIAAGAGMLAAPSLVLGQDGPVRIGILAPFSGPMALWGAQFKQGIEVYVAQHGNKAGGRLVEFLYRDCSYNNPDLARNMAQELLVRERVDYLGGIVFSPDALAIAPMLSQARKPAIIFNASQSKIMAQSPYFAARTGLTLEQISKPAGEWAIKHGIRKIVLVMADFAPGYDAETAFRSSFEAAGGGQIVDVLRVPLQTNDFTPFVQRAANSGAEAIFAFMPAGPLAFNFVRAYHDNGLAKQGIRLLATTETDESTIDQLGDAAAGIYTSFFYSEAHDSDVNRAFVAKLKELYPKARANPAMVEAWDGVHLLYRMIDQAGTDGPAALEVVKGYSWESPRGPVSIGPENRHIVQNVYIRIAERDANGLMINNEIETFPAQPDHGWKRG